VGGGEREGMDWVVREGFYSHMNNKTIKKKEN
jgi:hypothetical protein